MKFLSLLSVSLFSTALSFACQQGKVPDPNNMCIQPRYIQGCAQYATTATCNKCEYNHKLQTNGLCQFTPLLGGDCCSKRDSLGRCNECNSGMYLNDNFQCKQIKIMGCLQKNLRGKCINCASDFILNKDGVCLKGIKDCSDYLDNSHQVCIQCQPNHSLVNNTCLLNTVLGCKNEVDHSCKQCYVPFTLKEGHCEIKQCRSYNDFGCTACNCGFFITQSRICSQMTPGCLIYQRGSCIDCLPNFKLKGNICDMEGCQTVSGSQCSKCKDDYELKKGFCAILNCLEWENDICNICANGFYPSNGKCVQSQSQQFLFMPIATTNNVQFKTGL